MSSRLSKVCFLLTRQVESRLTETTCAVIARNALAQEESEEFSGDFSDPIDIHLDKERDGCAC